MHMNSTKVDLRGTVTISMLFNLMPDVLKAETTQQQHKGNGSHIEILQLSKKNSSFYYLAQINFTSCSCLSATNFYLIKLNQ